MVLATINGTGNITGNGYITATSNGLVLGGAAATNMAPGLFYGATIYAGGTLSIKDGEAGPIVWYSNVAATYNVPYPFRCANGIYINQAAAGANAIVFFG